MNSEPAKGPPRRPQGGRKCAVCRRPQEARFKPFCSARCANVDLYRWLSGSYRIPTEEAPREAGLLGTAGDDDADEV